MKPLLLAVLVVAGVVAVGGCGPKPAPSLRRPATQTATSADSGAAILGGAIAILERLDEFAEEEAGRQVAERLAEWRRLHPQAGDGGPDPLVGALPERLRPPPEAAGDPSDDVRGLRDSVWLGGIARQVTKASEAEDAGGARNAGESPAVGAAADAADAADSAEAVSVAGRVKLAARLFAWTVRSLASVADPPAVPTSATPGSRWFMPGEILLAGRASGPQRAWVFLELLRQAGIDGVMLATEAGGGVRPWLPAAVIDGEAYLFEPVYGMPVPGPGGVGIATARQAAADPGVLRRLSLPDREYPVQAADVGRLVPLVAADPWILGGRAAPLAAAVDRVNGPRLSLDSAAVLARARRAVSGTGDGGNDVRGGVWEFPFETAARRRAEPGRVRPALQADLAPVNMPTLPSVVADYLAQTRDPSAAGDDPLAAPFATAARPQGPRFLRPLFAGRVREFRGDTVAAREAYLAARPSPTEIAAVVATAPPVARDGVTRTLERMREDAGYWLGITLLAAGENRPAADFLERVTLREHLDGRWTDAARANLASALIDMGRAADAAALLRADESPQRFGSRLRANALRP